MSEHCAGRRQLKFWLLAAWFSATCAASCALALPAPVIKDLAFVESEANIKAIDTLAGSRESAALPFLQSLLDGEVQTAGEELVLVVKGDTAIDAITGKAVAPLPEARDDVVVNNRMRREMNTAIPPLKLGLQDRAGPLAAAKNLPKKFQETGPPALRATLAEEGDAEER